MELSRISKYDKKTIEEVSKQYGFIRDTFEKVLRLREILGYFNCHRELSTHLLLKGGTAINLTVFNLPRLSVDVDMDYHPNDDIEDMRIVRSEITDAIKSYMETNGYILSHSSRFSHSLDSFCFQYYNCGGNKDSIKIEINYSLRAHIFKPIKGSIKPSVFDDGMPIMTIDPLEIFAAKGNALLNRAAPRDLYDWVNMINAGLFKGKEIMFRKCFVFYKTLSAKFVTEENLFDFSTIESLSYREIKRSLLPVINKNDKFDVTEGKKLAKSYLINLLKLEDSEYEYIRRFRSKEYRPELLFEDVEIIQRIQNHPMALWKCRNF